MVHGNEEQGRVQYTTRRCAVSSPGCGGRGGLLGILGACVLLGLGMMPVQAAPFAYISNIGGGTVSVIDTTTNTVVATIPVGFAPQGVAVNPNGSQVYVTHNTSLTSVIDTTSNTVVATIPLGGGLVTVSPDGKHAYITQAGGDTVSVIDTATNTVVASIPVGDAPEGVAVSPDGEQVFVANMFSSTVSVIDTATNTVETTITVSAGAFAVAVHPVAMRAYVKGAATVAVIDTAKRTVITIIPVGNGSGGIAVTPDGMRVYVANFVDDNVSVIDTVSNKIIATVPVGDTPHGVAVRPMGDRVYVANGGSDTVSVIDTATHTVIDTVPVGADPVAFGQFISTSVPVCGATIPFRWPTGSNADFLSQDYAQFNGFERRPDHYHTGLDIRARRDPNGVRISEDVFAASRGEVEAVCPQGVIGGCVFGGQQFSKNARNHDLQGVVMLKHSLPDGRVVYSLYAHLKSVETFNPGQCVERGTKVGVTGGLQDKHLHFEIKTQPVLHNPVELDNSCTNPGDGSPSSECWGYTLKNPNNLGYRDPIEFLHRIKNLGFPRPVSVTETAPLRVGPGGFGGGQYPVINDIAVAEYEALGRAPGTAIPRCPEGWYQVRRSTGDCSLPDSCFDDRGDIGSSIPDGWICSRFISD